MIIRKKLLKIQERLGMRLGLAYGTSRNPTVRTVTQTLETLRTLYENGLRAFVLPKELFGHIIDSQSLYKEHYGELLKVRTLAQKYNIELALHHDSLPDDPVRLDETLKIFCTLAGVMDCRTFTVQPTFYKMMPQDQALKLVVHKINEIINLTNAKSKVGIETTGRLNELGSLEDVMDIVRRTSNTEPVINFGHIHARSVGALRSDADFKNVMNKVRASVGQSWLQNAYLIFTGVTYGPSGLIKKVPFSRSDISLQHLIKAVMSLGVKGTIIIDDPNREQSLLRIQQELADMVR